MGARETIGEMICVFLITALISVLVYFRFVFSSLSTVVIFFGVEIALWIPVLVFIIGLVVSVIMLIYLYYREWARKKLKFTRTEIIIYVILIVMAINFVLVTHVSLLPNTANGRNLILDIMILIEITFLSILLGIFVSAAKSEAFTLISVD